jgi:hypothetical protein
VKTERECEALAKQFLEQYINACKCDSRKEACLAIQKMCGVALHAHDLVETGKIGIVQ